MKQIVKAAALLTGFSVLTRAVGFLYRIYLSRTLGAEYLGIYQIVLSVFTVFLTLTSSGIPVTVSRYTAKYGKSGNHSAQNSIVTAACCLGLVISASLSAILLLFRGAFSYLFADQRCMPVFLALLPGFLASSVYSAFRGGLWGRKSYFSYSLVEFLEELSMVLAGVLLISGVDQIMGQTIRAGAAVSISYTVSAALTVILYFRRGGRLSRFSSQLKPLIRSSAPITSVRLASCVLNSFIAIILPARLTLYGYSDALALFGVFSGMVMPLLFLPGTVTGSINLVLVPEISSSNHELEKHHLRSKIETAFNFSLAVACIAFPAYLACGSQFASSLYHSETAGTLLRNNAFLMIPMALSMVSSTVYNSLGFEYKAMISFFVGAVVMLLCLWFLPKFIGIYALTVGHFANQVICILLNLTGIRKAVPLSSKFLTNTLILLGFGIASGFFAYECMQLFGLFLPPLFASFLAMGIGMAFSLTIALLFKIIDISAILKKS